MVAAPYGDDLLFADVTSDRKVDKLAWRADLARGRVQVFPGTGASFSGVPVMDNTGFSEASDTVFSVADIDGDGTSDKVYWNPRLNGGGTRVYLARLISGTAPGVPGATVGRSQVSAAEAPALRMRRVFEARSGLVAGIPGAV